MKTSLPDNITPPGGHTAIDADFIRNNKKLMSKLAAITAELANGDGIPKKRITYKKRDGTEDGFWGFTSDITLSHIVPLLTKQKLGLWYTHLDFNEETRIITYQFAIYDSDSAQAITATIFNPLDTMGTPTQSWASSDTTALKRFLRVINLVYDPSEQDPEYALAQMAEDKRPNLSLVDNQVIVITRIELNTEPSSRRSPLAFAYGHAPNGVGEASDNLDQLEVGLWGQQLRRIEAMTARRPGSLLDHMNHQNGIIHLTQPLHLRVTASGKYLNLHAGEQPVSLQNPAIRYTFVMQANMTEDDLADILQVSNLEDCQLDIYAARNALNKHLAESSAQESTSAARLAEGYDNDDNEHVIGRMQSE